MARRTSLVSLGRNCARAVQAGALYFALVFAMGFVPGTDADFLREDCARLH